MRLAVFHNLPSGGAKRVVFEHCRRMRQRGVTVDLFVPDTADESYLPVDGRVARYPVPRWVRPSRIKGSRFLSTVVMYETLRGVHRDIARAINSGGYDAAYLHTDSYTGAPLLARDLRIPSVYYCQEPLLDVTLERLRRVGGSPALAMLWHCYRRRVEQRTLASIPRIVVSSEFIRSELRRLWGKPATICRLGVDTEQFVPSQGPKRNQIISAGALVAHKGFGFLVDAVSSMPAPRPDLVLVCNFVEPTEERRIREGAKRGGVSLVVKSGIPDAELAAEYNRSLVCAYGSIREPFGLVPLEAMACGLPVVGVREGGVCETVLHGVTGFLCPRDPRRFGEYIRLLLEDAALRERTGLAAREHVQRQWSWEASVEAVMAELRAVAS